MRAVVVRNDKLGDSLLVTPLVRSLAREIPHLELTVVTDALGREVFRRLPEVGEVRLMPPFPSLGQALREGLAWRRAGVGSVFMTRPNGRHYALAARLSGATVRVGAAAPDKWYAKLLTGNRWSVYDSRAHFARKFLSLAEAALDREIPDLPSIFPFEPIESEPSPVILHLGGGGAHLTLTEAAYGAWAKGLKEAFGSVLLTGDDAMAPMAQAIVDREGVRSAVGQTSLDALASLQSRARVVVGVTTGAMHLAAAVGCPQAVAFLMRSADPEQWAPWMAPGRIVRSERFCSVCTDDHCFRTETTCRDSVRPSTVVEAALAIARS